MCYHGFKDIRNPHMTKPSKKTSISWRSASQNGGNALSLKDSLSLSLWTASRVFCLLLRIEAVWGLEFRV